MIRKRGTDFMTLLCESSKQIENFLMSLQQQWSSFQRWTELQQHKHPQPQQHFFRKKFDVFRRFGKLFLYFISI
jgi:hypothetical protein